MSTENLGHQHIFLIKNFFYKTLQKCLTNADRMNCITETHKLSLKRRQTFHFRGDFVVLSLHSGV